ncbi:hypothetical protein yberc0001_19010 [Yersinia bercovieri ATCC 43970]|uniref:Porphobilinogen synthase n=1 Tax=Yersinia bercovieri ATCC 43970 TaxID=349968 RepID=A0ABM9XV27_YERBE|nr:hypothetical protein yberc0001_19010 [Yersinia bercovieri ATCC 43970]
MGKIVRGLIANPQIDYSNMLLPIFFTNGQLLTPMRPFSPFIN